MELSKMKDLDNQINANTVKNFEKIKIKCKKIITIIGKTSSQELQK